jgi:putative FmdB family regulatory protein
MLYILRLKGGWNTMPIYEFSCAHCRKIFQFRSSKVDTDRIPPCPQCGAEDMKRHFSAFHIGSSSGEGAPEENLSGESYGDSDQPGGLPDDPFKNMTPTQRAKAEGEMMKLLAKCDSLDENNPRQLGHFLEKMTEITGDIGGPEVKEFIKRLKAGEDPEKLEEQFGELMEDEGLGGPGGMGEGPYGYDDSLYQM